MNRVTKADYAKILSLLATAMIMLLANGLQGTLVPVRAHEAGFSDTAISAMGASYFTGFLLGCVLGPRLIHRSGHIRSFAILGALTAATVLVHALIVTPLVWAGLRALIGFCAAGMFVILEGWLNQNARNEVRGRIFTTYATLNNLALLGGQYLFTLGNANSYELFSVAAILTMLCLVPVGATRQSEPHSPHLMKLRPGRIYRLSPVGAVGAVAVGLASGAFWTLAPVYAHARGMNGDNIALFMSVVILGGALAQFPLGRLSDFTDRRLVIGIAAVAAAFAGVMLANPPAFGLSPVAWLLAGGFLYGASAFPIGSLTNAHMNDHAEKSEMTEVANSNLFLYGVAAAIGPLLAAAVINVAGLSAIFFYTATIHAAFVVFVLIRVMARAPVAKEERPVFIPAPQGAAPLPLKTEAKAAL